MSDHVYRCEITTAAQKVRCPSSLRPCLRDGEGQQEQ